MLRTRVIPCLLLKDGALVKTERFKKPRYIGDPINAVRIFNEFEVDELIFLDINASKEHRPPSFEVISDIASECFMPVTIGGGIRTIDDIRRIFSIGIEKVAINSYAIEYPDFIQEAATIFGSQSIVVAIDVRKTLFRNYRVYGHCARHSTRLDPVDWAIEMEKMGAGELLLTSVDRDGTWDGYDIELIKSITNAVKVPVIVCGGAGHLQHIRTAVKEGKASATATGSMVVFQKKGFGVLINFPSRNELEGILV